MISTTITIVLLFAVLVVFAIVGVQAGRKGRGDVADYVLARGTQRAGALGISFFAAGLGVWILFAPAELGVLLGPTAVVGYAIAAAAPFLVFAFVGPRLRRIIPSGHGLTEFLRVRFGPAAGTIVALVSLLYMGVFLAAELLAIGGVLSLLGGVPPAATITAIVVATLAYIAYGGLRATLWTDRWQGWMVIVLLTVAATATLATVEAVERPGDLLLGSGTIDSAGITTALTLIIAVTAANLFHHGYWQRVWAARDERSLRRGALLAAALAIPAMVVAGGLGVLASGAGLVDVPSLAVFSLVEQMPTAVVAGVVLLGIALVTSSVDTLENGLAALLVAERPTLKLGHARLATVVIVIPAAGLALVAESVLQLFLIADLLCAAIVAPALLSLWRRATTTGAVAGALAGLAGAFAGGWISSGSLRGAVAAVTFPDAVPTLPPFAGAVLAGALVTVVVSLLGGRSVELDSFEPAVRARAGETTGGVAIAGPHAGVDPEATPSAGVTP